MDRSHNIRRHFVTVVFVAAICVFFAFAAFSQMPPGSFQGPPAATHHTNSRATGISHHGVTGHGMARKAAATP
jgi:hypothetical protein